MSLDLLHKIQAVSDRYAEERIAHDDAHAKGDLGRACLHMERLLELEAEFARLWPLFTQTYADVRLPVKNGMEVVWRRGAVGLQGTVMDVSAIPGAPRAMATVLTKRGPFHEFVGNLMPLSAVV